MFNLTRESTTQLYMLFGEYTKAIIRIPINQSVSWNVNSFFFNEWLVKKLPSAKILSIGYLFIHVMESTLA